MTDRFEPTPRELEIIYGYARGDSDTDIGRLLGFGRGTVGTFGYRMRQRMGARDRAHAVDIAYQLGILTVGGER